MANQCDRAFQIGPCDISQTVELRPDIVYIENTNGGAGSEMGKHETLLQFLPLNGCQVEKSSFHGRCRFGTLVG